MTEGPSSAYDRNDPGAEFDLAMARAGVRVAPQRRPALVAGYEDLKRRSVLLRQPRDASAEPAFVYGVRPRGTA